MQFRELTGVPPNLPPCLGVTSHMLMATPSSTTISRASEPYVEIPSRGFNHQRNGNLVSFLIGPEFPTIALCVAFEQPSSPYFYCHATISINGRTRMIENKKIDLMHFGRMCFSCSSLQELFEGINLGDENLVVIFCETSSPINESHPNITWIGVHVQCICPQP